MILGILLVIIVLLVTTGIRIVPEAQVHVVERLGKYSGVLNSGLNFINQNNLYLPQIRVYH